VVVLLHVYFVVTSAGLWFFYIKSMKLFDQLNKCCLNYDCAPWKY
jgi:hypothetical protein